MILISSSAVYLEPHGIDTHDACLHVATAILKIK